MARIPAQVSDERQMAVLEYASRHAVSASHAACFSYRSVAAKLGISKEQAKRAIRNLVRAGYLVSEARYLPNGGQLENAFIITPKGSEKVLAIRRDRLNASSQHRAIPDEHNESVCSR